jgi:hypothetical protein
VVWAQQAGHIYVDELDDVKKRADKHQSDHFDLETVEDAANRIKQNDQVIDAGGNGGCKGAICWLVPLPINAPVGAPLPVG